jgi:hypothetical protein
VNNGPVCIAAIAMRKSTTTEVRDRRPAPGPVPPSTDRFIGIDLANAFIVQLFLSPPMFR